MSDDAATTAAATTPASTDNGDGGGAARTFTQEQVNDLIAREKGNLQRKFEGYDDLKAKAAKLDELEAANKTDLERLSGELDTLRGELEPTKAENLRLRVAIDKKLPADLVDRLRGSTKEELEADADALLKLVVPGATRSGSLDGGPRGSSTAVDDGDMNARIRQAAGR